MAAPFDLPVAMKAADAKKYIGATDRKWKELVRKGDVRANKIGSFNVADLKALIQNGDDEAESGRQVHKEQAPERGADLGIRKNAGRGRGRLAKQAVHPFDALVGKGDAA